MMKFKLAFIPHLSAHLTEKYISDCSHACPVCTQQKPRNTVAVIQEAPAVRLLQCGNCKAISASHMPVPEYLNGYYQGRFAEIYRQYTPGKQITFHDEDRFAGHILRYLAKQWIDRQESLRIVDFGGGDGSLAVAVASRLRRKVEIMVIDHGPEWVREGQVHIEKRRSVESLVKNCHIVIASASLEHVPYPYPVIKKLYSLLQPGGYFYVRTPFVSPFMKLWDMFDFGYPAHLHDLGPAFWNSFVRIFAPDAACIVSQPSIVETSFTKKPIKTIIAAALKLPGHLEARVRGIGREPLWQYVGGWEAVFRRKPV